MKSILPNFKTSLIMVGITFMLLPIGLFTKGLMTSMAEFQVPSVILESPHYYDAMLWVYVHMMVIGFLIFWLGLGVEDKEKQKWISLFLFLITVFYTYLDFRTSDSSVGNGLYKGDGSVVPGYIGLVVNGVLGQLVGRMFLKRY